MITTGREGLLGGDLTDPGDQIVPTDKDMSSDLPEEVLRPPNATWRKMTCEPANGPDLPPHQRHPYHSWQGAPACAIFMNRPQDMKWYVGFKDGGYGGPARERPYFAAVELKDAFVLTHFTVTPSPDMPGRDPMAWAIQGSNTGATDDWTDLYTCNAQDRSGTPFQEASRGETVLFTSFTSADMAESVRPEDLKKIKAKLAGRKIETADFARPARAYTWFRIAVYSCFNPNSMHVEDFNFPPGFSLSQLELFGVPAMAANLDRCNVVWDSPSKNSSGSMPIGNGDIGMNVWVEESGDLLLLISKTDAWCENSRLLKIGRARISLSPTPFAPGRPFRQELKLRQGMIEISGGEGKAATTLRIWVDANRPVIRVETQGSRPCDVTVRLELWRTEKRPFLDYEWFSCWNMGGLDSGNRPAEAQCYVTPDTVADVDGRIVWYHRNTYSVWPIGMKLQGLESVMGQLKDPLLNRTFGAAICGKGLLKKDPLTLQSEKASRSHGISIYPLTAQTPTAEAWMEQLDRSIEAADRTPPAKASARHQRWWQEFWSRSWLQVGGSDEARSVTSAYTLQRWISACGGRGPYAIKFNGSIFTVEWRDGETVKSDPDYRAWGGDYWWQNTRLPYWPMLGSGDYDLMRPMFRMYLDTLDLAKARNRLWFNCDGAFMAETMSSWGMFSNGDYGWKREGKHASDVVNSFVRWIWSSGLDLAMMMLDYYDHTQDAAFLKKELLPWADAMLLYFDTRFARDAAGKLMISPAQAVETYQHGVVNPTPEIAGLHAVIGRLLELPPRRVGSDLRKRWKRLQRAIPDLPVAESEGRKQVLPAATYGERSNCENPELYSVFPFRIHGVGKPDLEIGRNTFAARIEKAISGWQQASGQAACLGLAEEARAMVATNVKEKDPGSRFPAFWAQHYDWVPDQDHGGNIAIALQAMLMQAEGRRILLFPAWPRGWDVEFKLHAPGNTVVEGVYRAGKLERLSVTPESRAGDVEVLPAQ